MSRNTLSLPRDFEQTKIAGVGPIPQGRVSAQFCFQSSEGADIVLRVLSWCIVHGLNCKAAAPTGIAAANVEVEGTDVTAMTLHALLELDGELKTKLDLAKLDHAKVAALMKLQVLLLDEVSMLDIEAWTAICSILSTIDHSRRPDVLDSDAFGSPHVILFGAS